MAASAAGAGSPVPPVRRVRVVGPQGAGKTHLARRAAAALGVPLVEVDALMRAPGGGVPSPAEFRAACERALAAAPAGWVVDGDDAHEVGLRYADADVVVWLDAPRRRTLPRLPARVLRPREGWTRAAEARALRWALAHHAEDRRRWAARAAADPARWLRLDPRGAEAWLTTLPAPRRVRVLGTSGSGKTTLARRAAARLGVPHLELDALQHREGWRQASSAEFDAGLAAFLERASDGWVVDGNYLTHVGTRLDDADVVVWLDFPRRVVMTRVVSRTLGRVLTRRELWNGNREDWRGMLRRRPEDNIVLWAWRTHADRRRRFSAMQTTHWVRLRSPADARRWLATLHR